MSRSISVRNTISAAVNCPEQQSQFMHSNIDCWKQIFDYMSFTDIISIMQTCKQMHEIVCNYFTEEFGNVVGKWNGTRDIAITIDHRNWTIPNYLRKSIRKLCINERLELIEAHIYNIKEILGTIEYIEISHCTISEGFFQQFFQYCMRLKKIKIEYIHFTSNAAERSFYKWKHPTLQHIEYYPESNKRSLQFVMMLKRNPNIKYLEIDGDWLLTSKDMIIATKIQLNGLTVNEYDHNIYYVDLLRTLYDRGICKSFHLKKRCYYYKSFMFDEFEKFNGLEALRIPYGIAIPPLNHLKVLEIIDTSAGYRNMEMFVINAPKLEHLHIGCAEFDDLLPFFKCSKCLSVVKLTDFFGILNLLKLNKNREKLGAKQKVIIYASESIYLKTKWTMRNLNLDLVDISRQESSNSF